MVGTGQGDRYRRNRRHLLAPRNAHSSVGGDCGHIGSEEDMNNGQPHAIESPAHPPQVTGTVTHSGRVSKPVCRLDL